MKKLFVGASISWDSLAVALGYLGQPLTHNNWYGNPDLQKKGAALSLGHDLKGNEVVVMGSPQPAIIRKVVEEIMKLGCPDTEPVEVIVLDLPGQATIHRLLTMARWSVGGNLALKLTGLIAERYCHTWWDEGGRLLHTEKQGCDQNHP